jgi:hypothetical protein
MKQELLRHRLAYIILGLGLVSFVAGFLLAWPNVVLQRLEVVILGGFYFFWGVVVHRTTGTISVRVVLEYFFVSVLACSLLLLLTM